MIKGSVKLVCVSVVGLFSYGAVMGFSSITLVSPVAVAIGCAAVSAAIYPLAGKLWQRILSVSGHVLPILCHLVVVTGIVMALFYLLNFIFAAKDTLHKEAAVVENKYTETRYQSKRISRNRYVRGDPYPVYYIDVSLPGGWRKPMQIDLKKYNKIRQGDTLQIPVACGLFGVSVMKR